MTRTPDRQFRLFDLALSGKAMREADRLAIESYGIPALTLMESAAREAFHVIVQETGPVAGKHIVCFCGKGNNGGDGYVLARLFATHGAIVYVYSMHTGEALSTEAYQNYVLLEKLARDDVTSAISLRRYEHTDQLIPHTDADILVDALLGTGIQNTVRPRYQDLIRWINTQRTWTVSMDLPSGLHADTGVPLGQAVEADCTISIGAHKTGLFLGHGPEYSITTHAVEIGIPHHILDATLDSLGGARMARFESVKQWLPTRSRQAHKYSVGMAFIVAGSPGMTGAAVLAAQSAEQAGVGAVVCATPQAAQPILATKLTETMTLGLPATARGIAIDEALDTIASRLAKASALLVGCGMGQLPDTQAFIRRILQQTDLPVVLDADGLNAFQGAVNQLPELSGGRWILTPHRGEFKRLAGADVSFENPVETVQHFAKKWNCVLILKGAPTLVGTPEGNVYINPTGHSALATAGTGDVLAGFCVGLIAQGLSPVEAALCALHIGGTAASLYASNHHPATMLASDLIRSTRTVLFERYLP